jgi:hypothetical protein
VSGAAIVLLVTLATAAGCTSGAAHDPHRAPVSAEQRALDEALDRLEERLLNDQASVAFWRELRARHESVSAIACQNLGRHAQDMALFQERQRDKRALSRKSRVATRFVAGAETKR